MGKLLFDQYSLLHFSVGVVMYFWGLSFWTTTLLHVLFELSENTIWGIHFINEFMVWWPGGKPQPDFIINQIGDTIMTSLGWIVSQWLDDFGTKKGWYTKHLSN